MSTDKKSSPPPSTPNPLPPPTTSIHSPPSPTSPHPTAADKPESAAESSYDETSAGEISAEESQDEGRALGGPAPPADGLVLKEALKTDATTLGSAGEIPPSEKSESIKEDAPASGPARDISPTDIRETVREKSQDDAPALGPARDFPPAPLKSDPSNPSKSNSLKKDSKWRKVKNCILGILTTSQPNQDGGKSNFDHSISRSMLEKAIQGDLDYTETGAKMLENYKEKLLEKFKALEDKSGKLNGDDLRKLKQDLIKLRLQIPLKYKVDAEGYLKNLQQVDQGDRQNLLQEVLDMMPQLHGNAVFETSPEFKDFEALYRKLSPEQKLCCLCFSVFPENAVIKKRMMVQWWTVEGYASEDKANEYFDELIEKGFIEAVNENRKNVGSCRMHPFYRSALGVLAQRVGFLNFDSKGELTQNFSGSCQTCLVGQGLISYEDLKSGSVQVEDLENVHLLININESILEFKPDWFGKMKNINYLYLGRWGPSGTDHREVEDTEFLKHELKNMRYLKFLSLQGVSNMIDLPESVLKLENLEILDIRACPNLETIPSRIGLLKCLTHLDMSDCYLLEHMPKSLSSLKALKVLKGFVVGNGQPHARSKSSTPCSLEDLVELTDLIKLCIYTGWRDFPDQENRKALTKLSILRKLTITWGGSAFKEGQKTTSPPKPHTDLGKPDPPANSSPSETAELPPNLEKLDLRYFPLTTTPAWLGIQNMKKLKNLRSLYIRGGRFSDIGQYQDSCVWDRPLEKDTWKVQVLRLRYLPQIEMDWKQLMDLFPDLNYLEQVECPRLTFFPCDANGIWRKKKTE